MTRSEELNGTFKMLTGGREFSGVIANNTQCDMSSSKHRRSLRLLGHRKDPLGQFSRLCVIALVGAQLRQRLEYLHLLGTIS
jgi:hypothetical protein